jgi:hypothetical protein
MLDVALKFLSAELNDYLLARTGADFGKAELTRIVEDTGKWAVPENHIGITLVNLEEERITRGQMPEPTLINGRQVLREPALKVYAYVLFTTNFQKYDVSLKYLSLVLTFFQAHPVFTPDRSPGLDPRIQRMSADIQSTGFEQLNQMWAFIGGKQLPSALYKVRVVVLRDEEPLSVGPPILEISSVLSGR